MQTAIVIGLALIMGAIVAIYLSMNSAIARHIDSSYLANMIFLASPS